MSRTPQNHHIAELTASADRSGEPSWALHGIEQIEAEASLNLLGHTDLVESAARLVTEIGDQKNQRKHYVLALAGQPSQGADTVPDGLPTIPVVEPEPTGNPADVLGYGTLIMPLRDNLHLAESYVRIRSDCAGRGLGTALWHHISSFDGAAGRTSLMTWTEHPVVGDDNGDVLVPPTGFGRIPPDRSTRFVERLGFRLEQAERHSQLSLPIDPQRLRHWRADAQARAGENYRLLSWQGRTPADLVDRMAELHRRMSIDVPQAGLDLEEEAWDAERVHDGDDQAISARQTLFWTVAEHVPTGQLTAYTALEVPQDRVGFAYQGDTLVHGDHRGHRLGMLVKAANLQQLTALRPAVQRVHTWNAGENAYMLAINEELGFRPTSYEAIWQLRRHPAHPGAVTSSAVTSTAG